MKPQETTHNYALTFEGTWAAIQESNRFLTEQSAETERVLKEYAANAEREHKKTESVLENTVRILEEHLANSERDRNEMRRQREEEQIQREIVLNEMRRQREEDHLQLKSAKEELKGISKSNGDFAENYFSNSFYFGDRIFFGEKFYVMQQNLNGRYTSNFMTREYDIVLFNPETVAIIEVKYKAREKDLKQVLEMPKSFRELYPEFSHRKIVLGLATLSSCDEVDKLCREYGIAILTLVGDNVVFFDKDVLAY